MLIDTHVHLIYRDRLNYPWLSDVAALDHDATYEQYASTARRIGIEGALHMEVDVHDKDRDAETELVKSLMQPPDSLIRGAIASCRPESESFAAWFEQQQSKPEIKGLRRILHVVPDELSTTQTFRDNVKRLSSTALTFDLCVLPRQMPKAIELIDHCPDVFFILDHCGVPDVKSGEMSPWQEYMSQIAERPNVTAKISGVMAYGDPDAWTLADLRPFVEHTINAFGWDRVIWGSDSPVCTLGGHIETWVAATHALIDGCSRTEKAALLHDNAQRIWTL